MPTILVVEDERLTREGVCSALRAWGGELVSVESSQNGREALTRILSEDDEAIDLLVTDVRMPLMGGLDLLSAISERGLRVPAIVLSAHADFRYAQEAISLGVIEYILKPVDPELLVAAVEKGLAARSPMREGDPKLLAALADDDILERAKSVWNPGIRKAVDYLLERYAREVGVREVADLVSLNQSYFCTLFKSETGYTFSDFVTRLRLRRAKELLLTSDDRVYEIAEAVGYSTARYFAKVFREVEGLTPREYRAKYRA
jgi:Response regulator containing CheY-like receiver domain and AraC-type DNA-binding domain